MLEYEVFSQRLSTHGGVATTKCAEIPLDTNLDRREDTFNPAELLLAALSACMLKSIERVAPILKFYFRGVAVRIHGQIFDLGIGTREWPKMLIPAGPVRHIAQHVDYVALR